MAALSSSALAVVIFPFVIPALVFVALLIYRSLQAGKARRSAIDVLRSTVTPTVITAGITMFVWLCLFGWSVAATVYRDHEDLVDELRKRNLALNEQCWMQNITLPAPRSVPAAMSASETVIFCNTEKKVPLALVIDYDQPLLSAGPVAFPEARQVSAMESVKEKQVFVKLDSPSILPYQIFIVTVYGSGDKAPLATKISLKTINPER